MNYPFNVLLNSWVCPRLKCLLKLTICWKSKVIFHTLRPYVVSYSWKVLLVASSKPLHHLVWLKDLQDLWCPPNVAGRFTGNSMHLTIKAWKEPELRGAPCPHLPFHTSQPEEREGLATPQDVQSNLFSRANTCSCTRYNKTQSAGGMVLLPFHRTRGKKMQVADKKKVIKMWMNSLSRSHTPDFPHTHISFLKTSCLSDGKLVRQWCRKFGLLTSWRVLWIWERFANVCLLASRSYLKCD